MADSLTFDIFPPKEIVSANLTDVKTKNYVGMSVKMETIQKYAAVTLT